MVLFDWRRPAKKPDITAFLPGDPISVDVTIVTQEAAAGAAAKKAAAEKKGKHSAAVNDKRHDFIPLAFETWGHTCAERLPCFRRL